VRQERSCLFSRPRWFQPAQSFYTEFQPEVSVVPESIAGLEARQISLVLTQLEEITCFQQGFSTSLCHLTLMPKVVSLNDTIQTEI
jgi:hypothetical protein